MMCPGFFENEQLLAKVVGCLGGTSDDIAKVLGSIEDTKVTTEAGPARALQKAGWRITAMNKGARKKEKAASYELIYLYSTSRDFAFYFNTCPRPLSDRENLNFFGPIFFKWPAGKSLQQAV